MRIEDFDFELPEDRIAQRPAERRDQARLLAHDVAGDATRHLGIADFPGLLAPGDLLVVNDTRVLPTRFRGRRTTGGRVEVLLLEPVRDSAEDLGSGAFWLALVQPARKLKVGEVVELEGGALELRMVSRALGADGKPAKEWTVELREPSPSAGASDDPLRWIEAHGHMPLPPYIQRGPDIESPETEALDRERYQTVYAASPGAVAAPTAGLHFTPELLREIEERGVERVAVTLHVGHGTFQPVGEGPIEDHRMHAEHFSLGEDVAAAVARTRERGGRVVAIGTTSARVLESCAVDGGLVRASTGSTRLYLYPGRALRVVDGLLTNFHLPRSSLLLLVSAFAGRERILRLYREAVRERYRFFSYGDAMFLHGVSSGSADRSS